MDYPSAADLNLYDIEVPEGTALSVFPPAREHMWDPMWYNQAGLDPFDQKKIFRLPPGEEQTEKLKQILEEYPRYGPKMYERAASECNADVIRALFDLGASLDIEEAKRPRDGMTENEDEDVPLVSMDSAVHVATFEGSLECVKLLIERGHLNVNMTDEAGATVLATAAVKGSAEIVEWLLQKGAKIILDRSEGLSDLKCAFKGGNSDIVKMIMEQEHEKVKDMPLTPGYLILAAYTGNSDLVKLILESGCFPEPTGDLDALTPEQQEDILDSVPQATGKAAIPALELLLPFITKRSADGLKFEYVKLEEMRQNQVFNATEDAIEIVDEPASFELVWETILCPPAEVLASSEEARKHRDDWLTRRLISASGNGCPKTTKLLCEKYGADIDHVSHKYSTTPLGRAAGSGRNALPPRLEVARYLLERGASIHLANGNYANGETPLMLAIREGQRHAEMVALLLEFGGPLEEANAELPEVASRLENEESAEIYAVAWMNEPRCPVRLLTKEQYGNVPQERGIAATKLEAKKEDLEKWVKNMQIRKRDSVLGSSDPKDRPLKPPIKS